MTEHSWLALVDHAIEVFNGDTPNGAQEAAVLERFSESPARVNAMVEAIGAKVAAGKVRSGWTILTLELSKASEERVVSDESERERKALTAETWIRQAGGQLDREEELVDALFVSGFGERGMNLRQWASDDNLRARLVAYWREQRPRFEAAEAEAAAYMERNRLQRIALREKLGKPPLPRTSPAEQELAFLDTLELPEEDAAA